MNERTMWWPIFSQQLQLRSVPYTKDFETVYMQYTIFMIFYSVLLSFLKLDSPVQIHIYYIESRCSMEKPKLDNLEWRDND